MCSPPSVQLARDAALDGEIGEVGRSARSLAARNLADLPTSPPSPTKRRLEAPPPIEATRRVGVARTMIDAEVRCTAPALRRAPERPLRANGLVGGRNDDQGPLREVTTTARTFLDPVLSDTVDARWDPASWVWLPD